MSSSPKRSEGFTLKSLKADVSDEVAKHGWCIKQGGNYKTWKRRYACIVRSIFYYFKSIDDYHVFIDPSKVAVHESFYEKTRQEVTQGQFDFTGASFRVDEDGASKTGVKTSEPLLEIFTKGRIFRIFFEERSLASWISAFRDILMAQESYMSGVAKYLKVRDIVEQGDLQMCNQMKMGSWQRVSVVLTFFHLHAFKSSNDNIPMLTIPVMSDKFDRSPNEFSIRHTTESASVTYVFKGVKGTQEETQKFSDCIAKIRSFMQTPKVTGGMMVAAVAPSQPSEDQTWSRSASLAVPRSAAGGSDDGINVDDRESSPNQADPVGGRLIEPPASPSGAAPSSPHGSSTPPQQQQSQPLAPAAPGPVVVASPPHEPTPPAQPTAPSPPAQAAASTGPSPTAPAKVEVAQTSASVPPTAQDPAPTSASKAPELSPPPATPAPQPSAPTVAATAPVVEHTQPVEASPPKTVSTPPPAQVHVPAAPTPTNTASSSKQAELEEETKRIMQYKDTLSIGAIFTKHGRLGKPHRRFVFVDFQNKTVGWSPKPGVKTGAGVSTVDFPVIRVIKGCQTDVFRRVKEKERQPQLCFSIITYGDRTLDVQTDTQEQRDLWVEMLNKTIINDDE